MPELPEVETVVRALRPQLVGRTIIAAHNKWARQIATPDSVGELQYRIHQLEIKAVSRRAKYLLFTLTEGETLIIHLKMSGHLSVSPAEQKDKHVHSWFELDNGLELQFRNPRKFGRIYLTKEPETILGKLGPEPLEKSFTPALLATRISSRKRPLKPLLLDQTIIAGIGNIYADEALFLAKLHPEQRANELNEKEIKTLHHAIQTVLNLGIEREGASISQYIKPDGTKGSMQHVMNVFRRTGFPCYNCQTIIKRIKLGGRSTHFCPTCQTLG